MLIVEINNIIRKIKYTFVMALRSRNAACDTAHCTIHEHVLLPQRLLIEGARLLVKTHQRLHHSAGSEQDPERNIAALFFC